MVFTVSEKAVEVDVAKSVLPEYVAVRLRLPAGRVVLVSVAMPLAPTVPVPSCVEPLRNVTVPSDEPVGAGVTVAVSVTVWPNVAGLGEPASTVVVGARFTVNENALDVEVLNKVLPE